MKTSPQLTPSEVKLIKIAGSKDWKAKEKYIWTLTLLLCIGVLIITLPNIDNQDSLYHIAPIVMPLLITIACLIGATDRCRCLQLINKINKLNDIETEKS